MKDNLKYATFLTFLLLMIPISLIAQAFASLCIGFLRGIVDVMYSIQHPKETKFYYWMGWK